MDTQLLSRADVLNAFGADTAVAEELLAYDANGFGDAAPAAEVRFPLADESFCATWRDYSRMAETEGIAALASTLVQLRFPIAAGISASPDYQAATRRGAAIWSGPGLALVHPGRCSVTVHPTWAGAIPIIQTGCREDFVSLLRAFTHRNEPAPVPDSMGACIVAGYNNWDRFGRLRQSWEAAHPDETFSIGAVAHHKEQYQDRFILLSNGPYSGVAAATVGLTEDQWARLSLVIRREHECAHYWTRRVLSSMRNCVLDEIIADACGVVAACGRLRGDWLLTFLGLDHAGECREHGRLHNYRGTPPLSDATFALLRRLVVAAAANLDTFGHRFAADLQDRRGLLLLLLTLTRTTLEELASSGAAAILADRLRDARGCVNGAIDDDDAAFDFHSRG
jgi:hypothetical protein